MLIFGLRRLLSLKSRQIRPQNSFLRFSLKIQLFLKKLLNKKIFSIKFLIKKGYIHFWCKMTPVRSHSDTVGRVANKVRVEGGFAPFNPYFYVSKYRSSDALPALEIFTVSSKCSKKFGNFCKISMPKIFPQHFAFF